MSDEINFSTGRASPNSVPSPGHSREPSSVAAALFGDHTFFLDSNGLNIVELTGQPAGERTQAARVASIANWSDATKSQLASHEPEPTDAIVELGSKH